MRVSVNWHTSAPVGNKDDWPKGMSHPVTRRCHALRPSQSAKKQSAAACVVPFLESRLQSLRFCHCVQDLICHKIGEAR